MRTYSIELKSSNSIEIEADDAEIGREGFLYLYVYTGEQGSFGQPIRNRVAGFAPNVWNSFTSVKRDAA